SLATPHRPAGGDERVYKGMAHEEGEGLQRQTRARRHGSRVQHQRPQYEAVPHPLQPHRGAERDRRGSIQPSKRPLFPGEQPGTPERTRPRHQGDGQGHHQHRSQEDPLPPHAPGLRGERYVAAVEGDDDRADAAYRRPLPHPRLSTPAPVPARPAAASAVTTRPFQVTPRPDRSIDSSASAGTSTLPIRCRSTEAPPPP